MAARPGMTAIIQELRRLTDTSDADVTVNNITYWTDEQLQSILDQHRTDVMEAALIPLTLMEAGERVTLRYYLPATVGRWIENDPSQFKVVDTLGNAAPTYTIDLAGRQIIFNADTNQKTYYLRCRFFDLKDAAAQVWLEKAGLRAELISWKAGGQSLSEDQEYEHCMQMYRLYGAYSGIKTVRMIRGGYGQINSLG